MSSPFVIAPRPGFAPHPADVPLAEVSMAAATAAHDDVLRHDILPAPLDEFDKSDELAEHAQPWVPQPPQEKGARALRFDPAFGDLAPYCADESVTDIFVNGDTGLFVNRGHGMQAVPEWSASEREVRALAVALIGLGDRHVDDRSPCVDVRLDRGIRVHVVLGPVAVGGTAISIRIPRVPAADLPSLQRLGSLTAQQAQWLESVVHDRLNVLITGGTGTGKTTLLSALLSHVRDTERIVTIEDVAELQPQHPHHVALESRQANLEGAGEIDLARLVRESLRMRPDRIVVGECRGEEIRDLLTALNTGHDGGAGTLHASSLDDVPARLEALGALAGMGAVALARQTVSAFSLVVHVGIDRSGKRQLAQAGQFVLDGDRLGIVDIQPWATNA
ncbi:TadA family conjugal transfer-associated ATPase [Microbacterium sp. YY-01]|uniref:TadA family conjugal transfer-associated ATPase n=1 Tax=Microbacterium sp. YY-01 TaxID=3421634 RepID=UPI003D172348